MNLVDIDNGVKNIIHSAILGKISSGRDTADVYHFSDINYFGNYYTLYRAVLDEVDKNETY